MTTRGSAVPLEQRVADQLARLVAAADVCLLAVSGGPDSIALLDLLQIAAPIHRRPLIVGHVDHGISPESAGVADQVRAAAASRGLPFHSRTLHLGAGTTETRARAARRAALVDIASAAGADVIVLAHHADDQAETVLLRILRGSGPAGLAGMAPRRGPWVRPLLAVLRSELTAHLVARGLESHTDPENTDPRHLRSWLRHEVLPILQARLPDVIGRLNQSAAHAANARAAWAQLPGVLAGLQVERSERGISVAAPVLQGYRSALRYAVLAAIGRQSGVLLGQRRLAAIDRLLAGRSGSGTVALGAGIRAELAFGRLTLFWLEAVAAGAEELAPGRAVHLAGAELRVTPCRSREAGREGWSADVVPARYLVRQWRVGDRIRPLGGAGSRAVSVMLREARVSPARRKGWPVVVTGDDATIVWVPGICRSDVALPAEGTEAWRVECAVT